MNVMTRKEVKKVNDHLMNVELNSIQKLIPLIQEQDRILVNEGASSVSEFEFKLNERSGFTNPQISAKAYDKEDVLNRLYAIEKELDGKLSSDDLTKKYQFKPSFLNAIQEKHTIYFTKEELEAKKLLEKAMDAYNAIPHQYKNKVTIDRAGNMIYNPFNRI